MDAANTGAGRRAELSFIVVLNGTKCAPLLVQRGSFICKVGNAAARKTYQTAYAPKDFSSATRVSSDDS